MRSESRKPANLNVPYILTLLLTAFLLFLTVPSGATSHPAAPSASAPESTQDRDDHFTHADSEPFEPVGEIIEPSGSILVTRAVEEKGGFVFSLTRESVLHVYDVSDLPDQQLFRTYDSPIQSLRLSNGGGLLRNDDFIYVFGFRGIEIIDVQEPGAPTLIGSRNDLAIFNLIQHKNYLVAVGGGQVAVYSVEEPSNPRLLSVFTVEGRPLIFAAAVFKDTLYTSELLLNTPNSSGLRVIDFSDPFNLSPIKFVNTRRKDQIGRDDLAYHLRIVGKHMIECATSLVGLWSLDTPTDPVFRTSESLSSSESARVCALDRNNVVVNGKVFRLHRKTLNTVATFDPGRSLPGGSQVDGFPYGSAVTKDFVFIAQSRRILILSGHVRGSGK